MPGPVFVEQVALIVNDYDEAIRFFVDVLGFELVEDSPVPDKRRTSQALGGGATARRHNRAAPRASRR